MCMRLYEGEFADVEVIARKSVRANEIVVARARFETERLGYYEGDSSYLNFLISPIHQQHWWRTLDQPDEIRVGDLSFVAKGQRIETRTSACEQRALSIKFSDDCLPDEFADGLSNGGSISNIRNPRMYGLIRLLRSEMLYPGLVSNLMCESLYSAIVIELYRVANCSKRKDLVARDIVKVEEIRDCIEENISGEISIEFLATQLGMSVRHLMRTFKNGMGITVWKYVGDRRVEIAKNMLMMPNTSIKSVSHKCGFESSASFATAFRKATGCTPTQFQAQAA